MKTRVMKTAVTVMHLFGLYSLPALAAERPDGEAALVRGKMSVHMRALGNEDGEALQMQREMSMVKEGLLGTVNILRELDVNTWTNRVTVTSNGEGKNNTKPDATIGGGSGFFDPKVEPSQPVVLTYTLPGLRTVSSLAICYRGEGEGPERLPLEVSADAGQTWFPVFDIRAKGLKCFKPAKVNALRLTQEGKDPRTTEVFVYGDPEVPLPLFGFQLDSDVIWFHLQRPGQKFFDALIDRLEDMSDSLPA